MTKIPHVKVGDQISADDFNAVAQRLERFRNLRVAPGSGLILTTGPYGHALTTAIPHPIWGKLSGSSSPYTWVEVAASASGAWTTFGKRGGTKAYEINNKANLNNKVVQLWWTEAGDMRFAYEGVGLPAPVGCTFCLAVQDVCTLGHITPTSAVLKTGSTVVATATIGNQLVSVSITAAGSGYSNGWHTLGISGGGGSGAAGEFFVSSGHVTSISLTANGSGYASAPTISFPGAGGSGATATATVDNTACFQGVPVAGYTLEVTASGYLNYSGSVSLSPCATKTIQMTPATYTLSGTNVKGCPSPGLDPTVYQSGISVQGVQGTTSETTTTDASGNFSFTTAWSSASGVVLTFTDPAGRFNPVTYTYTPINLCVAQTTNAGSNGAFGSTDTATGYACACPEDCFYPIKKTLHMTESAYGATGTLTWSAGVWSGTLTIPYAGCSGNDGTPFSCPGASVTVNVTYAEASSGGGCYGVLLRYNKTPAVPPGTFAEYCPNDGGAFLNTVTPTSESVTCAPALSVVSNFGSDACGSGGVFPGGTTITITE